MTEQCVNNRKKQLLRFEIDKHNDDDGGGDMRQRKEQSFTELTSHTLITDWILRRKQI